MADHDDPIEHWNGEAGHRWVRAQARMDAMLAPLTHAAIERADPRPGERALDVGCGCGGSTLALAERGAQVLGIDVSAPMLQRARERGLGRPRVQWLEADAARHSFDEGGFELLFSRFGVMFFAEPEAAFTNLRQALVPGGRACLLCWQAPEHNPWLAVPMAALRPFSADVPMPAVGAPGPFAFADPARVTAILRTAGFRDVDVEPRSVSLCYGADLDRAMALATEVGMASRVLATLSPAAEADARKALRQALAGALTPDGVVLDGGVFLVTARA